MTRRPMLSVLIAGALMAAVGQPAEAQNMDTYAIAIIVAAPDTKQQHKAITDWADALAEPTQCEGVGQDRFCAEYLLKSDPTKRIRAVFVINGDVAHNLGNELEKADAMYLRSTTTAVRTREFLRDRANRLAYYFLGATFWMRVEAGENLASKQWEVVPVPPPTGPAN